MTIWKELHTNYQSQKWIEKPSLFAETSLSYFPRSGRILELGAGLGQDSQFFLKQGYEVVTTDLEIEALEEAFSKLPRELREKSHIQQIDLRKKLPFKNGSFDVVYAHLSLHYFDQETTREIIQEIERVLKPGGVFAFLTNSVSDPEYATGDLIEPHFFQIGKVQKRFFSVDYVREITNRFQIHLLDQLGQTYKDSAKGHHELVRFIGKKPLKKDFSYTIPCVGAIIERERNGQIEILLQTRWKPNQDPLYSGTFEFPIGTLDRPFENLYQALAREIREECGLTLKRIKHDSQTLQYTPKKDAVFGFRPFCCTQQLKEGKPWIAFIFICEVENGIPIPSPKECKDIHWVNAQEVKQLFTNSPEKFFSLELPAWEYYFANSI